MSLADPIASGRFETKIATSSAMLTPCPVASPIPSTAWGCRPEVRRAPAADPPPYRLLVHPSCPPTVSQEESDRADREVDRDGRGATDPQTFLGELKGDTGDQGTRAEGQDGPYDPLAPVVEESQSSRQRPGTKQRAHPTPARSACADPLQPQRHHGNACTRVGNRR